MRISDDRYSRDRLRLDLAVRFIEREARTRTIRLWTGLTDDRIRKLYRSYLCEQSPDRLARHRGKSPQQVGFFVRTSGLRLEASILASVLMMTGALPSPVAGAPLRDAARKLPGPTRGDLLCQAYDYYCFLVGDPGISFEHAVLLVIKLANADELALRSCTDCGAVVISDPLTLRHPRCACCRPA
ncbi:MAG TPA: hypothetical protein VMI92_08930 [Steroidobacteraceae bacterium]|nr:hypothetical protein [Steroidobacteraceae bacterium]